MAQPLLDVVMIVKNEEKHLPGCLASLTSLGDVLHEVCIYDTGSTDRTIELAVAAGARVERGYWDGDFARARNAAAAMTHAKWLLTLDADERVQADPQELRRMLQRLLVSGGTGFDVGLVQVANLDANGVVSGTVLGSRLYRPGRGHYVGRIHENVEPRPNSVMEFKRVMVPEDAIRVEHIGYSDNSVMAGKGYRNAAAAAALVGPETTREEADKAMVDEARSLMLIPQMRAQGIAALRAAYKSVSTPAFRLMAGEFLADVLIDEEEPAEAAALARELLAEGSPAEFCDWVMGRARAAQNRHQEALECFRRIERPMMTGFIHFDVARVLAAWLLSAAQVGEDEEAISCGIALVARHGKRFDVIPLLLALWAERPSSVLATLFVESDRGYLGPICLALDVAGGQGPTVAQDIRRLRDVEEVAANFIS